MIAILDYSKIDIEVSDADMETVESDSCRGVSEANRNANGILAIIQEEARFFHKDGQKFIDLFIQSISGLY